SGTPTFTGGVSPTTYAGFALTAGSIGHNAGDDSKDMGINLSATTTATPTFSPVAGTYLGTQSVTISDATAGATICYTTDGTTPTANGSGTCTHGTTYSTAVSVASSLTLKAIGSESGFNDSSVGSAAYVIGLFPTADLSTTTLNFTQTPVGGQSASLSVTLTNNGNAPLTITSIAKSTSNF